MATYYVRIYQFSDITGTAVDTGTTTGVGVGDQFTVAGGSTQLLLVIDDTDPVTLAGGATFHDGASDLPTAHAQTLAQPLILDVAVTIWSGTGTGTITIPAGSPIPIGTRVEMEFEVDTTTGETFYYVRIGAGPGGANNLGTNIGIAGTQAQPIIPGTTYTISDSGDLSGVPYGVLCFAGGTLIETPDGAKRVEDLVEGDLVTTFDNGSQSVRWIGRRHLSARELRANPALRPITFAAGALGNSTDLTVSPQHRMLLSGWQAEVYFGEEQILVAAKALVNDTTVRQNLPEDGVTYFHLLFDRHEILISNGALSESFHPGDVSLNALSQDQITEIEQLFPELPNRISMATAYPVAKVADARGLQLVG